MEVDDTPEDLRAPSEGLDETSVSNLNSNPNLDLNPSSNLNSNDRLERNDGPPIRMAAPQVVLLVLGLVLFASGWFVLIFMQHDVFFSANHVLYFEPMARFVGEALREGRIPLWNPYCYCGMSQIANVTPSPFYPFTWLFAVLDYQKTVALSIVIHELIGLGGTFLLLRVIGTTQPIGTTEALETTRATGTADNSDSPTVNSKLACLTGSLVFMLCGCLQPGAANFTIAATAAWIPWCLWAQIRLQRATERAAMAGGVAVLAIVAAMNMLGGCIELSMLTMGIVKFIVILDAVKRFRAGESWFGNALRQWCALLIGTLIAAPSLLPATEWLVDKLQYSVSVAATNHADSLTTLLGFLYPTHQSYRFTEFASLLVDGKATGELLGVDHVITCFGPIVLALAAFGISRAARRKRILLAAAILAMSAFCFVSLPSLDLPFARFLPSAFLCHPTAPFMVLVSLVVAFAVAEGISALKSKTIRYSFAAALVLSLVPCSYFNVDAFCTTKRDGQANSESQGITDSAKRVGITDSAGRGSIAHSASVSKSNEVPQSVRIAISPRWAIPALISGPNEQVDSFTVGKEADRNINQKLLNACGYQATPSPVYRYVVDGRKFLDPLSLQALTGASIVAVPKRGDYPSKYPEAEVERFSPSAFARCSATIDWTWNDSPAQAIAGIGNEKFLSNPSFIERNSAQSKDSERLQNLPSGLLNPPMEAPSASPEKEVLTREDLQRKFKSLEELKVAQEAASLHGKVELMHSEPEHVVVSVILDKPAFVVLKDAFYPGWKVSIDAIPTTCYRANAVNRAVFVDKGSHLVQFDFKPDSYAIGLKCFVMGLAVFFYLAIWSIARLIVKTIRFLSYGVWE